MVHPDKEMRQAVAEALDETGLSPAADNGDVEALLVALHARGYAVTKLPEEPEDEENEEEEAWCKARRHKES